MARPRRRHVSSALTTLVVLLTVAAVAGLAPPAGASPTGTDATPTGASAPAAAGEATSATGSSVTRLVASPGTTRVALAWSWSGEGTKSFTVRRDDGIGTPSPTAGTLVYQGDLEQAVDDTVAAWTNYRYTIWADDGAGGYLAPFSARTYTGLQRVGGLTVTGTSGTTATVRWTQPTDPGAAAVVVTRSQGGGSARTVYSGTGTTFSDTGLVPGVSASYRVVAQDASGRQGLVSIDVRLLPTRTWTTTVASPWHGWPGAMACATSTWCLALDNTGSFQVMSGTTWSAPVHAFAPADDKAIGAVVGSLTCPAAGRCLGVSGAGIVEYSGGTWRTTGSPSSQWSSLDCPTTTYCVAVRSDGWSTTRIGTTWQAPVRIGTLRGVEWDDVSCQAAYRCFAVGSSSAKPNDNWRGTLTSSGWSTGYLGGDAGSLRTISCTPTSCLGLGDSSRVTVSGTTWSQATPLLDATHLDMPEQVSCASPTLCVAMNFDDVTRWSTTSIVERTALSAGAGRIRAVSCPRASTTCFAVDNRGRFYRWTASTHWKLVTTYVQTWGGVNRIGCRTPDACSFVDYNGWLVVWDGARWTRTSKLFAQTALVECSGPGFCLATDGLNRRYRVWSKGAWGPLTAMPVAAGDLSCSSPTLCLALDPDGHASRFDGVRWQPKVDVVPTAFAYNTSVSCAPAGDCMVTSEGGRYRRYLASGRWDWTRTIGAGFPTDGPRLACASSTSCLATTDDGTWAQFDGRAWTVNPPNMNAYRLATITCWSPDHCIAPHGYSNDWGPASFDAGTWTSSGGRYTPDYVPTQPECPTPVTCFVGGMTTVSRSS
ncbi:fibronectin type III domain-containing protein [Intrasporangium flavum]|uniref:fibronectin type III domain-containing protein n=1 Tax=Intrasporangium flavum TaxID=1428657 RepID=UPI00096E2B55|nr:fibronectin type III domain-containing protein [Intrasporangium flavum]